MKDSSATVSPLTRRQLLELAVGSGMAALSGGPTFGQSSSAKTAVSDFPVKPYIDYTTQLAPLMPWRPQSFYLQPWRGYIETVPAANFLAGIGMNYNLPSDADDSAVIAYMADAGVRALRIEIPWTIVPWSEDQLNGAERFTTILTACLLHGVRPIILLNANDGAPCPHQDIKHVVDATAPAGARTIVLDGVGDITVGRSGLSGIPGYPMAGILVTAIDSATRTATLSRPLPQMIEVGSPITVTVLKYAPLYPSGTPEFADTSAGWLRYVMLVCTMLRNSGVTECDFEVWNELSFGSSFTQINNYYDPPLIAKSPDFLNPGGCCWELARQTQILVSQLMPQAQMIWGFSNTTFYQTPITKLPASFAGQSYHPYGTGKQTTPNGIPDAGRESWFIEGYIPQGLTKCMPEGWAHLGIKTEHLTRLLYPPNRLTTFPPESTSFEHYMTEHGFVPAEAGITDAAPAEAYKAKCLVRALLFWLNKGISKVAIYCAYDQSPLGMGMLTSDLSALTDTPAMAALRRLTKQFAGAAEITTPAILTVDVTATGTQPIVFHGDAAHPDLPYRDMFTFLPFQVSDTKFVCAFYVMSYDITNPPPAMEYHLAISSLSSHASKMSVYEPISGKTAAASPDINKPGEITVLVHADEIPRLLCFELA